MEPKVTILWLNFNSYSFMNLAIESLQAVKDLDYSNYELIIVDNGSVDASIKNIKDFVEQNNIRAKVIQLGRNLGYTGGNNVGYLARDPGSKYLVLLNNDAVPKRDSLKKLVEFMETDESLGAAQGVVINYDRCSIDTAGDYLSELFDTYPLFTEKDPYILKKSIYITSADGAYSIFRIRFIQKAMNSTNLFDDFLFAYYDDYMLGVTLWNSGFKIKAFPLVTAKHKRGSSFDRARAENSSLQSYFWLRNRIILNEISNNRYKNLIKLLFLTKYLFLYPLNNALHVRFSSKGMSATTAFVDGIRIGKIMKKHIRKIDIYKVPILRIKPALAFLAILTSLISVVVSERYYILSRPRVN